MDIEKVGKAIAYLRKRAGYTQRDLAERIGVSDKAISKWERGIGLPDVAYLGKLSILLDTDTDSLLAGDVIHHDKGWTGLLILDENPCGIGAGTIVYDKPLINYLLSYFMLVGIKDIRIMAPEKDQRFVKEHFGDGSSLGIRLRICDPSKSAVPGEQDGNVMTVFGKSILYGVDQTRFFQRAMHDKSHLTILVLPRSGGEARRLYFDSDRKIIERDDEDVVRTQYPYRELPIVFSPAWVVSDCKSTPDVGTAIADYAVQNNIYVQELDRGYVEFLLESREDVSNASAFVRLVQQACGMNIYCLEEVAWRRGMIGAEQLHDLGMSIKETEYGRYILNLSQSDSD